MRIVTLALLAVGAVAIATPAMSEDVVIGGRVGGVGVGVDIGHRHHYRDHYRERVTVGSARGECKTVIIKKEGITKKIRRCY